LTFSSEFDARCPGWLSNSIHPFFQKTIYATQKLCSWHNVLHILTLTFQTFWLSFMKFEQNFMLILC
jgi:hypothetical protein